MEMLKFADILYFTDLFSIQIMYWFLESHYASGYFHVHTIHYVDVFYIVLMPPRI